MHFLRDWYHVWNVHSIHSRVNHRLAVSKIVKFAQPIHSPINRLHLELKNVVQNVPLVLIRQQDWPHAHHAHFISIKIMLDH